MLTRGPVVVEVVVVLYGTQTLFASLVPLSRCYTIVLESIDPWVVCKPEQDTDRTCPVSTDGTS